MHASQRLIIIEEYVNLRGFASHEELVEKCHVSTQTIRRDIAQLSEEKKVIRLHGGVSSIKKNLSFSERRLRNAESKKIIGKLASELIADMSTLFIGGGTTLEAATDYLTEKEGLFVITTNLHVALAMQKSTKSTIMVPHGEIEMGTNSLVGGTIRENLSRYRMDIALISCVGIDAEGNFYENRNLLANNVELMQKYAKKTIILADSSKLMKDGVVKTGSLSNVEYLVTDKRPSEEFLRILKEHNVKLIFEDA